MQTLMRKRSLPLAVTVLLLGLISLSVSADEPSNKTPKADEADAGRSKTSAGGSNATQPKDTSPCQGQSPGSSGKAIPALDDKFVTRVECHIMDKNICVEIEEYYDAPNNRGSVVQMKNGVKSTYIYNFKDRESYIIKDNKCTTQDLSSPSQGFNFFTFTNTSDGHVGSINDIFRLGKKYGTTYVDNTTIVRGMAVDHWRSCIKWDKYKAEFQLDWYFTQENYSTALGKRPIPVRATLTGKGQDSQGDRDFNHMYDFTWYRPGDFVEDYMQAAFEIPRGIVCKRSHPGKSWPGLTNQFFANIEIVHPEMKSIASVKRYYDFTNRLSRKDFTPNTESYYNKYGKNPLQVIRDYSLDMEFVIDKQTGKCYQDVIHPWADDAQLDTSDPDHLHMMAGNEIMHLGALNFTFQGQRRIRSIPCDVWTATSEDWPKEGSKSEVETYYMATTWTSEAGKDKTDGRTLIGIWINTYNMTKAEPHKHQSLMQVYDFTLGPEMFGTFDITACFNRTTEMKHIVFRLNVKYDEVYQYIHFYEPAIKESLSKAANVSTIRLGDFFLEATNAFYTDVWCSLTQTPKPDGQKALDVPQASLDEAYKNLEKVIGSKDTKSETYLDVVVNHENPTYTKTVQSVQGSLATDKDVYDPRKKPPACAVHYGYTSGSMAGLAFAMLFIGMIGGMAVGWYLWRRKRGIPYSVHR